MAKRINLSLLFRHKQTNSENAESHSESSDSSFQGVKPHEDSELFEAALTQIQSLKRLANDHSETIGQLRAQMLAEKEELRSLRTSHRSRVAEEDELKSFFVKCINEVKKDVQSRRVVELGASKNGSFKAFKNECLTGTDQFSAANRRRVIDQLVTNENALLFLYDRMFPADCT